MNHYCSYHFQSRTRPLVITTTRKPLRDHARPRSKTLFTLPHVIPHINLYYPYYSQLTSRPPAMTTTRKPLTNHTRPRTPLHCTRALHSTQLARLVIWGGGALTDKRPSGTTFLIMWNWKPRNGGEGDSHYALLFHRSTSVVRQSGSLPPLAYSSSPCLLCFSHPCCTLHCFRLSSFPPVYLATFSTVPCVSVVFLDALSPFHVYFPLHFLAFFESSSLTIPFRYSFRLTWSIFHNFTHKLFLSLLRRRE